MAVNEKSKKRILGLKTKMATSELPVNKTVIPDGLIETKADKLNKQLLALLNKR